MVKKPLKWIVVSILGWQVRRLYKHNHFTTVGVVGSYGKTSTKRAIAEVLEHSHNVQYQKGNYNDLVSVPLVFFGLSIPSLFNPLAWAKVFYKIERQLRVHFPYEAVVLELGTDGPGQIEQFGRYLRLDIGVVTSIGPEHMEYFKNLNAVAKEELSVRKFSKHLIINGNLCAKGYLAKIAPEDVYHVNISARRPIKEWSVDFAGKKHRITNKVMSETQVYSRTSAYLVAQMLDEPIDKLEDRISTVKPAPGRMQLLRGIKGSVIIDDTYNASPEAVRLALDTIYAYPAKQRIALLGMMNELGADSERHHREIGKYCEAEKLAHVVTLGVDANQFLASEAERAGCTVYRAVDALDAARYISEHLSKDAIILAKGSQNGVYAEEAVKQLLANPEHATKLVRQSSKWLKKKKVKV